MAKLSWGRRLLKLVHPEGIPWPGTFFYNAISTTSIFQQQYELVANDILSYCAQGSLLDIGTGPAWLLLKLHQRSPTMRLVGIDSSPSMVVKARKNMAEAGLSDVIEVREGNASQIPFADRSFDIVVSTGSIHHWKHPIAALNDVYRVLKPGGYALMYDLVTDTPADILKEMARQFGKLKMTLFWLHGFEEPFYNRQNYESLARPTLFMVRQAHHPEQSRGKEGRTQFVGLLCCLILVRHASCVMRDASGNGK